MANIGKSLRSGSADEKVKGTALIAAGCGGGNPLGTALATPLADLVAKAGDLDEIEKLLRAAELDVSEKAAAKKTAMQAWNTSFDAFVPLAQTATGGDPEKIRSLNMTPVELGTAPGVGAMTAVLNLATSTGDFEGTVELMWDKMRGARTYVIQMTTTPTDAASWKLVAVSVKSSFMVEGLTSGTKYYFRVAAVGTSGQGPWSDLAEKIAA